MTKKRVIPESSADKFDKLFAQIDPEVMFAAFLGAMATYGGIVPPMTRLLMAISGKTDVGKDINEGIAKFLTLSPGLALLSGGEWSNWYDLFNTLKPVPKGASADAVEAHRLMIGMMASGAMEGMIMMTLVKSHPELLGQSIDSATKIGAAVITAAGEAVPF